MTTDHALESLLDCNEFIHRHIGPNSDQIDAMLAVVGAQSLTELMQRVVPANILKSSSLAIGEPQSEHAALNALRAVAGRNEIFTSLIGLGYHDTLLPNVIRRNVLENPGWYTAYTPYQPEIAQGRLEALLIFQQMIMDLTGMDMANASLLDEATAAAEAMTMAKRQQRNNDSNAFFVDADCYPQTLAVIRTRAEHFGFDIIIGNADTDLDKYPYFGALLQNPGTNGAVRDLSTHIQQIHQRNALAVVAADPMSLVLLRSPGSMGADIVIGTSQRFGVPMGLGGPHAAFFAFREDYKRAAPGRIIGVSIDRRGKRALRMALQTREQHIRREKANSNICTSQVLLAVISAFYAVYHGPDGLRRIASRIHVLTTILANGLGSGGLALRHDTWFDTLSVVVGDQQESIYQCALAARINLRKIGTDTLGISLNETSTPDLVTELLVIFGVPATDIDIMSTGACALPAALRRTDTILAHPYFNSYHSETEMLRYLKRLEARDFALNQSMIPLGSCTMKLNATAEMIPVTWPEFAQIHPFAPAPQTAGYREMFAELESMLATCTGYAAISLQPNAGSQGEYAGLLAIKKYHQSRGDHSRNICLIPASAHGTNPASAHMAGMRVVLVKCDERGNVDIDDLRAKAERHASDLAAVMLTYPSTHGVFEEAITDICAIVHDYGGQVYIDGANLNAMVGVAEPGQFGGDVSHLNLHKTFCIPHGGGGPGMGPIGVRTHLKAFLPGHPLEPGIGDGDIVISAAPWGSASILPIAWMYIRMMGGTGLTKATQVAILNANYVARKLSGHYQVLYTGRDNLVAHECILDIRPLKDASGITEEDIAKRLIDYGFHAPTMSFPVAGTLMIEPTESESKAELDRFIEAMVRIRSEIERVSTGDWDRNDNPLRNAPHTLDDVLANDWKRPYDRDTAGRPAPWLLEHKIWPSVNRIDNVYGDRNLMCACPPLDSYVDA